MLAHWWYTNSMKPLRSSPSFTSATEPRKIIRTLGHQHPEVSCAIAMNQKRGQAAQIACMKYGLPSRAAELWSVPLPLLLCSGICVSPDVVLLVRMPTGGHQAFLLHFVLAEAAVCCGLVCEEPAHGLVHLSSPDQRVLVRFLPLPLRLLIVDLFPAHFRVGWFWGWRSRQDNLGGCRQRSSRWWLRSKDSPLEGSRDSILPKFMVFFLSNLDRPRPPWKAPL